MVRGSQIFEWKNIWKLRYLGIQRIRKAFIKTGRNYVNEIIKANIYEQQGQEKLLKIIENVSEQLKMNEYKEMQLLAVECISDELKKLRI